MASKHNRDSIDLILSIAKRLGHELERSIAVHLVGHFNLNIAKGLAPDNAFLEAMEVLETNRRNGMILISLDDDSV